MAILNSPNTEPPDQWRYVQPQTGVRFKGDHGKKLTELVVEHRMYKGIEPSDPESVWLDIQRQICSGMPPGVCHGEEGENYHPITDIVRNLNFDDIMRFMAELLAFLKAGLPWVEKSESERRAAICRGCRFNRNVPKCSCAPLWALLKSLVPSSRTEPGLQVCGVCGCALTAKVLVPSRFMDKDRKQFKFPSHCWINHGQA